MRFFVVWNILNSKILSKNKNCYSNIISIAVLKWIKLKFKNDQVFCLTSILHTAKHQGPDMTHQYGNLLF